MLLRKRQLSKRQRLPQKKVCVQRKPLEKKPVVAKSALTTLKLKRCFEGPSRVFNLKLLHFKHRHAAIPLTSRYRSFKQRKDIYRSVACTNNKVYFTRSKPCKFRTKNKLTYILNTIEGQTTASSQIRRQRRKISRYRYAVLRRLARYKKLLKSYAKKPSPKAHKWWIRPVWLRFRIRSKQKSLRLTRWLNRGLIFEKKRAWMPPRQWKKWKKKISYVNK